MHLRNNSSAATPNNKKSTIAEIFNSNMQKFNPVLNSTMRSSTIQNSQRFMSISNESEEKSPKEFTTSLTRESNNPPIKPRKCRKNTEPCPMSPLPNLSHQFSSPTIDTTLRREERFPTNSSTRTIRPNFSYHNQKSSEINEEDEIPADEEPCYDF